MENQQALLDLCEELSDDHALVRDDDVKCWIRDMDVFVREDSAGDKELPLANKMEFFMYLRKFVYESEKGREYLRSQQLGFDMNTGNLVLMSIQAQTFGDIRDSRIDKLPLYNAWECFLL